MPVTTTTSLFQTTADTIVEREQQEQEQETSLTDFILNGASTSATKSPHNGASIPSSSSSSTPKKTTTNTKFNPNSSNENNEVDNQSGSSSLSSQAAESATTATLDDPLTPEVDHWTTLMTDGTDAAFNSNGNGIAATTTVQESKQQIHDAIMNLSEFDKEQIEQYWDTGLMSSVSYLGSSNAAKVKYALAVAYCAHLGQKRKSGEPFIIHPVEVAKLLAGLKMDAETVMAGLLHDTVEDTELTFAQVEALFGPVVMSIVEGETKVSKLPKIAFSDYADEQAENLRQMFVAMTDDYRIIIVKLADRLHNMRTLRHMKPEKQVKISRETLDIFAPLAHRMGIWQFKSELEDTSFLYLFPEEYKKLHRRLRMYQTRFRDALDKSQAILEQTLAADPTLEEQKVRFAVSGRTKELYSLWHKMEAKHDHNLDHIADVVALRVILDKQDDDAFMLLQQDQDSSSVAATTTPPPATDRSVWLCYHVLGLVQNLPGCQPVPTRVKDYISFPKPNGYQSIHTAIMFRGQMIEVQIRTSAMHRVAEYGMASHWAYTSEKRGNPIFGTPWLASIKEYQNDDLCSRDFVECVRRELLGKRVFVFLRNGKILNLARGATVVDAAFQIHTEVGLGMHGAEINGKGVPVSYELKNGDVVNILTGEGKPAIDWMRFANVRSTRSKLRSYFKRKQRESLQEAGYIVVKDFLDKHKELLVKSSYIEGEVPTTVESMSILLPGKTQYNSIDDLLIDVGKRHDRDFLRTLISKMFKVPSILLNEADGKISGTLQNKHYMSESAYAALRNSRRTAREAASAIMTPDKESVSNSGQSQKYTENSNNLLEDDDTDLTDDNDDEDGSMQSSSMENDFEEEERIEVAETDQLCSKCLPVHGDDIIGTRTMCDPDNVDSVTVHRRECGLAQRAINRSKHVKKNGENSELCDVLNEQKSYRVKNTQQYGDMNLAELNDPVKMCWPKYSSGTTYLAEISVYANDRKLLLADCSEVVSEYSDIVRTGSVTTKEHAVLDFLVQVKDLMQLQQLMDALNEIRSVMSVERKFGKSL